MIRKYSRGAALVETALTIGIALLIVLGAGQAALIGYTQISADGAAFIAAHTAASNPNANSVNAARGVFPKFDAGDFATPSPSPNLDPSVVTKTVAGFSLIPGLASSYTVNGKDVEYQAAAANASASTYSFDINNTKLHNYCDPAGGACPTNHCIYLAQSIGSGNGNGANGLFAEWRAHQRVFARLAQSFHSAYPGSAIPTNLDPTRNNTDEGAIVNWDSGAVCS
jgi:hypothetical protein